jgi:hypothetical protein
MTGCAAACYHNPNTGKDKTARKKLFCGVKIKRLNSIRANI